MCESESGYIFRFNVYCGKDESADAIERSLPANIMQMQKSEKVVLHLIAPLLDKGFSLYVDNYYTSCNLFSYLHHRLTNACGTLKNNKAPTIVRDLQITHGKVKSYSSNPLLCIKFHDSKPVTVLTSIHNQSAANKTKYGRKRKHDKSSVSICKPNAAVEYRQYMSGVDNIYIQYIILAAY